MSGTVGGAGTKSGIIGRKWYMDSYSVVDYEEGTYTPVPNAGTINTISHNRYRKVGGVCWLEAYFGNIQSPGFGSLGGMPFATNPSGSSYENCSGNVMANGVDFVSDTVQLNAYVYNNAVSFYTTRDDSGWASKASWDSGDDIYFSVRYFCAM